MNTSCLRRLFLSLMVITLCVLAESTTTSSSVQTATITFISVPEVLPRNEVVPNYSPLVSIQYSGLEVGTYTVRVHLLETDPPDNFECGCTNSAQFWCPASFTINNQSGANSSGTITDARITDINNQQNFLWKAELFKNGADPGSMLLVSETTRPATSTLNRAPVLNAIGTKTVALGQTLDFNVSASDAEGNAFSFSAHNLPAGATFNNTTGQFQWQPSALGTFPQIGFVVTQTGGTPLSDAELITIEVVSPPQITLSAASNTTVEGAPAVLFVRRSNGGAGTVTVSYSTVNGTANSGSDFEGVANGVLTFVGGEVLKTISLKTLNDSTVESNETFQVVLSSPTGATLGSPSQTTITVVDDDTPQAAGRWSGVDTWPSVPIHMHLLPNGKLMFWDRHGHDNGPIDHTPYIWDPLIPETFTKAQIPTWDVFCSGHTLMADGRLFVAGGHIDNFIGTSNAAMYDPQANVWTSLPNMNAGRWYPTSTILPNGDLLVMAGTRFAFDDINTLAQVLQVNSGTWRTLSTASFGPYPAWPDLYPYSYVAPNGKIFLAGPQKTARYLDTAGTGTLTDVANSSLCYRDYGSSVMYHDGKVLVVGGNPRDDCDPSIPRPIFPSASAEVIDLNATTPAWRPVASMTAGRRHHNATILPDGKVLVTGGSSAPGHDDVTGGIFFAELWDPTTELWTLLASHARYRGYHSNALLLPDARVLVAGGGHPNPDGGSAENNAEIYSPPYLFKGPRPVITTAPNVVTYGQNFFVQTPDGESISNVNWIRLSSVTHAFNESQRINRLTFSQASGGLSVSAPGNANLCPPGHYMLFVLNSNGVPSVAKIVQIVDSVVQFDVAGFTIGEGGGSASITVRRSGATNSSASVNFSTSNDTAIAGSDYTTATGTLTFNAGETAKTFSVPISDDALFENDELLNLTLGAPVGVALGQRATATLTIVDNDGQTMQLLLEESTPATNFAAALDSAIFLRDPFLVVNNSNFFTPAADRNTRLVVFVRNLQLSAGEPSSSVVIELTDSGNTTQSVNAEDVRIVPGFDFAQVVFRLPGNLPAGNCTIRVLAHGQTSNSATIRISAQ